MEKILSYIEDTYAPAALFVYGSYADGSAGPDSDFDALALVADGPARHDVSRVGGVQLDLFIHPAADFQGDFPMAEFLRLLDGKLVWDLDGSGKALLEKLAAYRDGLPAKTPEENRTQVAWCRKMLQRAGRGDAEGLFRWHWLLVDSLEICCDLCGRASTRGPRRACAGWRRPAPRHTPSTPTPSPAWTPPPWSGGWRTWRPCWTGRNNCLS